jgi:two-component system cell cycle response regulator DivK
VGETITNFRPVALLVADDDTRRVYSDYLSSVGFEVLTTESAGAAFRTAIDRRPHLIIADVHMPSGADGIRLLVKLRLDMRTTTIPIIVITDQAIHTDEGRTLAAGCDLYLAKPCQPDVLADNARTLVAA